MCVRTLISNEVTEAPMCPVSKFTKAKVKYMKVHDEIIQKEKLQIAQVTDKVLETGTYSSGITPDILAESTTIFRKCLEIVERQVDTWKDSKTYKILVETTQPAHVIVMIALLSLISALIPTSDKITNGGPPGSRIMSFMYLMFVAMHFGSQIWMTFVSGLSLYFALPRHNFGEVQRVLFPRYFTINACLSLTTLLIFIKHHPTHTWDSEIAIQIFGMTMAFFVELLIRLYMTPPLLQLMVQKNLIERAAGVGNEVGTHQPRALKHCPHYLKIHGAFRKIHVTIAMGNMTTMCCTVLHLHYISSKLCVL
ncbi:transmembrane protein 205 [Fopius arisanus]|uniref:Transmembrane protein 205 n=1 Tax=Fopius arisanus TaxID=64838 RepID=A0A9R1U1Q8_9HYME|nr:PREDICTED: transmembrane protein 205 [Fopius arisanus]